MPCILSICLCGRNDDYGVDFKRRFVQSMNFLAWSAKEAGVLEQIEVVFCDWNSDVPLAKVLFFSEDAARMVRFIEVPPEIARPLNYRKTPFHTTRSWNVTFRHAKGKFVTLGPSDILLTRYSIRTLVEILAGKINVPFSVDNAAMLVPRKMLPRHVNDAFFFRSPEEMERRLTYADAYLPQDPMTNGCGGAAGMIIVSGDFLKAIGGLDEDVLGGWGGSDDYLALMNSVNSPVWSLSGFGVICYDFETSSRGLSLKAERLSAFVTCQTSRQDKKTDWGLSAGKLLESHAEVGDMSFPEDAAAGVAANDSSRERLFARLQDLQYIHQKFITSPGAAVGDILCRFPIRSILLLGPSSDSSILSVIQAAGDPLLNVSVMDPCENNVLRYSRFGRIFVTPGAKQGIAHPGTLRYMPGLPEKEKTERYDLVIVDTLFPDMPKPMELLAPNGFILSRVKLFNCSLLEYSGYGVYLYTDRLFDGRHIKRDWAPMPGNLLTPLWRYIKYPVRWRALLGRCRFSEWPLALKILLDQN